MRTLRPHLQKEEFLTIWNEVFSTESMDFSPISFLEARKVLLGETSWDDVLEDRRNQYILKVENV
jgi:hypothetical protein